MEEHRHGRKVVCQHQQQAFSECGVRFLAVVERTDRRSFEAVDSARSTTVEKKTPKSFTWTKEYLFIFFKNSVLNMSNSSRVKLLLLSCIINISSCFEMRLTWKNEARHQITDKSCGRSVSTRGALAMEWWLRADCLQLQLHSYGWNAQTQQQHLPKLHVLRQGVPALRGPDSESPVTFSHEPGLRDRHQRPALGSEAALWHSGGAIQQCSWELNREHDRRNRFWKTSLILSLSMC